MEGTVDAGRQAVTAIVKHALETAQAKDECLRLARYCVRLELVLVELQLLQRSNEALRGSKTVFLAIDAAVSALRQAEQLVAQCAATNPSSIWPLEDAVEFQGVAAELRSAAAGLAALGGRLSPDVQQDAAHVYQQLMGLSFTEDELSETEELELERVQHINSTTNTPRHPAAAAASGGVAAAPPAAPPGQFTSPGAALDSGAVLISEAVAAAARRPPQPSPDRIQQVHQRESLAEAAAVAHEAAADVLPPEDQSPDESMEPGEQEAQLMQEIREEAEEAAAAAAAPVVLTYSGETALAPEVPAKGAVPSRGGTPLPRDPFEMTGEPEGLGSATLQELRTFQQGQDDLAVADEAQRQLEASADNLSLKEQQARAAGSGEAQALAALKQLHDYESAMEAGEAAEEVAEEAGAGAGEEAEAAAPEGPAGSAGEAAGPVLTPLHKSRSQQAAAVLDKNLAELASEWAGGEEALERPASQAVEAAEPAAPSTEE
ncbi:hypothetical protein C2E21_9130 [Chlorella sorokiniana]|uniref:Uncharacterized protein n=1 Tax=Chlorella sorokiniana TaxID=3076 RepID=A0A2P6TC58_CHLSO|nr:hypothetical protein C2E21_9130 [Chlorella sorokiniana]|eukprot:PRW20217.1 hypothetical protein C2E21_9130 [Chlorella sorokiniana]